MLVESRLKGTMLTNKTVFVKKFTDEIREKYLQIT